MKIVILDKASIGEDTPLQALDKFGEVICYNESSAEEAIERSVDADVIYY
jgi:glycerate dehydrogenase